MQYPVNDNVITYDFVRSGDKTDVDLSILFDVGMAAEICYIKNVQLTTNSLVMMVSVLKDFCSTFSDSIIVFALSSALSDTGAVAMRCALAQAGFRTLEGVVDDPDGVLFMYESSISYVVKEKLIDETLSFILDEMVRTDADEQRLNLLLSRIGETNARKLEDAVHKFLNTLQPASPKMVTF